jgi:hypothetical protein
MGHREAQRCGALAQLLGQLLGVGGKAIVADAANFGAGNGDFNVAVAGDLLLKLFVKAGFEFTDLTAAETGDMDVIAWAVGFVIVTVATEMQKIELVDETLPLEKVDGAVDRNKMDVGIDLLGALEDLIDVEMLFGAVHDLEDDTALAREANAALAQRLLEVARGVGGIDTLAGRDAPSGSGGHEEIVP